jgi:hypothetical protein
MIKFWTILMFTSIFLSIVAPICVGVRMESGWSAAITFLLCISFFVFCVYRGIQTSRKERAIRRKNQLQYRRRMNRMWNGLHRGIR